MAGSTRNISVRVSDPLEVTLRLARPLLHTLGARGREINGAIGRGDFRSVIDATIDPTSYTSVDVFWRDYQAVNLLRKCPNLPTACDTSAVAIEGFLAAEVACRETNGRLRKAPEGSTRVTGWSYIHRAQQLIAACLGDFHWDRVSNLFTFTNGASSMHRRAEGEPYYKYRDLPGVTRRAALAGVCAIESVPTWASYVRDTRGLDPVNWVKITDVARITTVPKNAKTDRVIGIEPELNMFLQKGFGRYIRKCLKRVGIDLDDQIPNQELARLGSLTGELATLDLSAASDSISKELVRVLLPRPWYEALDLVRTEKVVLPSGSVIELEKFSCMGNGFTFELESLIFWALSAAVAETYAGEGARHMRVYGDDIIVPTACSGALVELLEFVGFKTNVSKSFLKGPFRESCGKHYFNGVDVTPFYISKPVDSVDRLYWWANSLREWASRPTPGFADSRFLPPYERVVSEIPSNRRYRIPKGFGDIGIVSTFSEALPQRSRAQYGWEFRALHRSVGRRRSTNDRFAYLMARQSVVETFNAERVKQFPELFDEWGSVPSCEGTMPGVALILNKEKVQHKVRRYRTHGWDDAAIW